MTHTNEPGKGHDFLARIADDRRRRVAEMQRAVPMHVLRTQDRKSVV